MNFKKILSVFLALALVFALGTVLASCGGDAECTEHVDNNTDGKCDTCGAAVENNGGDDGKTAYTVTVKDVEFKSGYEQFSFNVERFDADYIDINIKSWQKTN